MTTGYKALQMADSCESGLWCGEKREEKERRERDRKRRSLLRNGNITPLRQIRILNLQSNRCLDFPHAGSVQHSHMGLDLKLEE